MTLSVPRLLVALYVPLMFVGCASIGPPLPPSLELQKPPSDLRALRKGNTVTLTWTAPMRTTDRQTVRSVGPTRICRSVGPLPACGMPVDELPAALANAGESGRKRTATYRDNLSAAESNDPSKTLTYAVEALNGDGRAAGLSNQVVVPAVKTPGPPAIAVQAVKDGVQVTWRGLTPLEANPLVRYKMRLRRQVRGETRSVVAAELALDPKETRGLYVDQRIEWEKTYEYRATVVTVISAVGKPDIQIESEDSPEVEVLAHDVFPPSTPSGVQAVFASESQNNFIDLIWAPAGDADLAGYNVYRHEAGTAAALLNTKPVSAPAYRDLNVSSGKDYLYSVSAVDVRGNESEKSAEATEHVP
jgi:hypothetical protein